MKQLSGALFLIGIIHAGIFAQTENMDMVHGAFTDPRMSGQGYLFDNYPITPPRYMNHYENYQQGKATMKLDWGKPEDHETIK